VFEDMKAVSDFPIARYICQERGKRKVKAATFSLLPTQAVPYHRFSLSAIFGILTFWKQNNHSVEQTLDHILRKNEGIDPKLHESSLGRMSGLFEEARERLSISGGFCELVKDLSGMGSKERAVRFLERVESYRGRVVDCTGPCALEWDYYSSGGGCFSNAHFLFGTPSQFRSP
jgi:hypothetical protein